jgi:hypothetical protein
VIFDWHDEKHERNLRERGFGFDTAARVFAGRVVEWQDTRRDYGEVRMIAVGRVGNDMLTVVYTDRGDVRWIITAWPANRKERALWLA